MKLSILPLLFFCSVLGFSQTPQLIFHSGFEPGSTDITDGIVSEIYGIDNSVSPPNNWVTDLDLNPLVGVFSIQYQGGDNTMRMAKIVADPTDPSNKVLQFWLKHPNVDGVKGRVQANLYSNPNFTAFYQSTRLYLPSHDWNIIKNATGGTVGWLTIMEYWNNMYPLDPVYPFRITLGVHKKQPLSTDLTFSLEAQRMDTPPPWPIVWEESNTSFSVPVDKWMTLETYYKEGDSDNGRFILAVTPEGGPKEIIFDVTNFTHHPFDPNPDGLFKFNPMKLYTSDAIINYVRDNGGVLQVYWDDFELWKDINLITSVASEVDKFKNIKIYPNPMRYTTILEFENNKKENYSLILFDTQGKIVKKIKDINTNQITINKGNLSGGLYFYRLYSRDNKIISGKITIE